MRFLQVGGGGGDGGGGCGALRSERETYEKVVRHVAPFVDVDGAYT